MVALRHPFVMVSLALWLLNDHVLKQLLHNGFTGKLSDVTCLIVCPLLPLAALDIWVGEQRRSKNRTLAISIIVTGLVMTTINLFPIAADAYRVGLALLQYPLLALVRGELPAFHPVHLTVDATDLWTLPALAVPLALAFERERPRQTAPNVRANVCS